MRRAILGTILALMVAIPTGAVAAGAPGGGKGGAGGPAASGPSGTALSTVPVCRYFADQRGVMRQRCSYQQAW